VVPIDEAARRFGVHPTTIYRYVRMGLLKKYKKRLDRRTYIDSKALEELRKRTEFEERK
jgi:DNA-binding transcriptional MerR regulator